MMPKYLVYRTGSNAANQPMTLAPVPIAIVQATSPDKACETTWGDERPSIHGCPTLAAEVLHHCGNLEVWANQSLHAVPESRAKLTDWNAVLEADSLRPSDDELEAEHAAWAAEAEDANREYYESLHD